MSRRFLGFVFLAPIACSAQQFGTKADRLAASGGAQSPVGAMPLLQMLIALGIVFVLLKFGLPKLVGKLNKKLVTGVNGSIRIEESANFAGGSLYVVEVRNRQLLLSVGSNGVACLADLSGTNKPQEAPLFMEVLAAHEQRDDLPEFAAVPVQEGPAPAEIKRALERLSRLGS